MVSTASGFPVSNTRYAANSARSRSVSRDANRWAAAEAARESLLP